MVPGLRSPQRAGGTSLSDLIAGRRQRGELPLEVQAFLLVGRVLQKQEGGRVVTGVVKYWQPTFGHGRHHDGMTVHYPPPSKPQVDMPTEFNYCVFWEDEDEPEMLSLEEVQKLAQDEWAKPAEGEADWLPASLHRLVSGGPDSGFDWAVWDSLDPDTVLPYIMRAADQEQKEVQKAHTAAARAALAAERGVAHKARAPSKPAAGGAAAKPKAAAAKAKARPKEVAPMRAAPGVQDALAAAAQEKHLKRKAALEAKAAGALLPSPRPAKAPRLLGNTAPLPAAAAVPAAAAARVAPSLQDSPAPRVPAPKAGGSQLRQPEQQQQATDAVAGTSSRHKRSGGKALGATAPAAAAGSGRGKQALLSPGPSGKSARSAGSQPADALSQDQQELVAPSQSGRLRQEAEEAAQVKHDVVHWYDRVVAQDGTRYRVYSKHLIVPEAACCQPRDRRLRTWKGKAFSYDEDYIVEGLLAEKEGEAGEKRWLVKWRGFEADPAEDSWLAKEELSTSKVVLADWKAEGRQAWMGACRALLEEAGL